MESKVGAFMELQLKHFYSLFLFVIPSIIISIVLFILDPPSITIIIGFIVLMVFACLTYYLGIRGILKESK
jgi:peptidoglycan/LPS O-acetylase OafA/YrhL